MKIYIRANSTLSQDVPQELTMNNVKINYNSRMNNKYKDVGTYSMKEKIQFMSEVSSVVADVFSADEIQQYNLMLYIDIYRYNMYSGESWDTIEGKLVSGRIESEYKSWGHHGTTSNTPFIRVDKLPCSQIKLDGFKLDTELFKKYLIREDKKLIEFEQAFASVPEDVRRAAYKFRRQIVDESLGRHNLDNFGKAWLKSRTVNNNRSQTWCSPAKQADGNMLIDALFDWVDETDSSYQDLVDLSNKATKYYTKRAGY